MKKWVRVFLAAALVMGTVTGASLAVFPDVDADADYAEAAECLDELGIMSGDQYGNFNPENTVTRAEMATITCRLLGETEDLPSDERFPDVPVGHWANGYVSKAAELGIVTGYDTGLFGPADEVTYEQAVTMIVRTIYGENLALELGGYPNGYIQVADECGILSGTNFEIGTLLTRADIAVLIQNTYTG